MNARKPQTQLLVAVHVRWQHRHCPSVPGQVVRGTEEGGGGMGVFLGRDREGTKEAGRMQDRVNRAAMVHAILHRLF